MSVAGAAIRGAGRDRRWTPRATKQIAKKYGATDVVDYKDGDIVAQIMELTNNEKSTKSSSPAERKARSTMHTEW